MTAGLLDGLSDADKAALQVLLEAREQAVRWRCALPACDGLPHPGREWRHARTAQRPPWDRTVEVPNRQTKRLERRRAKRWYLLGGRGSGKTWSGAHALAELILWLGGTDDQGAQREYAIVAPTYGAAVSVCVEGQSGLLKALGGVDGPHVKAWVYSRGEIQLTNGAVVYVTGADTGAPRAQGRNLSAVWADEVGLWRLTKWRMAWVESIVPALRKAPAYSILTGTPKRGHPLVRRLVKDPRTVTAVMPTRDNLDNLDPEAFEEMLADLEGTSLAAQELEGAVLDDIPGALWTAAMIEDGRVGTVTTAPAPAADGYARIAVGWDPAVTSTSESDEHGIVVVAKTADDPAHLYGLEDASGRYTPLEAARKVQAVFDRWAADVVIGEVNNGGDFIGSQLATVAPAVPVDQVRATRGKHRRAEPVVAVTQQTRLHVVGEMHRLEEQMTTWSEEAGWSPDRMDALVWAAVHLLEHQPAPRRRLVYRP